MTVNSFQKFFDLCQDTTQQNKIKVKDKLCHQNLKVLPFAGTFHQNLMAFTFSSYFSFKWRAMMLYEMNIVLPRFTLQDLKAFHATVQAKPIEYVDPVLAYLSHSFLASRTLIMTTLVESSTAFQKKILELKSVNLQYITLGYLDDGTNESSTKSLMFQLLFS